MAGVGKRRPGTQAGLDVAKIVTAAQTLDPESLTMTAVAQVLGVDRKAIAHHIADRDELLRLVASSVFVRQFEHTGQVTSDDWREAVRQYASEFVRAASHLGPLLAHLELRSEPGAVGYLHSMNRLAACLDGIGIDAPTITRLVVMLTNLCVTNAADMAQFQRMGVRTRPARLRKELEERGSSEFPMLVKMVESGVDTYGHEQLSFTVEMFIAAVESLISQKPAV